MNKQTKLEMAETLIRQRASLKKQLATCEMNLDLLAINAIEEKAAKKTTFRVVSKKGKMKGRKTSMKPKKIAKSKKTADSSKEPMTHTALRIFKAELLNASDKEHTFESMFKKWKGSDKESSLRANFSKVAAYASNEGSILRTQSRPLTIRKRNIKKIRGLDIQGFNAFCASTKRKKN